MKQFILIVNLLLLVNVLFAQPPFKAVEKGGKYGFENEKGKLIIKHEYDQARFDARFGVFILKKANKTFYLDFDGKIHKVAFNLEGLKKGVTAFHLKGDLDIFPKEILKHRKLEILILEGKVAQYSKLNEIPKEISTFKRLKVFACINHPIKKLSPTLGKLKKLRLVNLSNCPYLDFSEVVNAFKNVKKKIWLNNRGFYQSAALDQQILKLVYLFRSEIPASIGDLKNLYRIEASNSYIHKIAKEFWTLTNLEHLSISGNHFKYLPPEISQLTNLEYLLVSNNSFHRIPEEIGKLTRLKFLGIGSCKLSKLPNSIGNLTNLEGLYAPYNLLSELPDAIGNLKKLKHLGLNHNRLQSLPNSIGNLTELERISLNDNSTLKLLPSTITNWKKLQVFNATNSPIQSLPENINEWSDLIALYANRTKLKKLPNNIVQCKKLETIWAQYNQIPKWPEGFFELKNMKSLRIGYNELNTLPEEVGQFTLLEELDVEKNNIKSIPNSIRHFKNITWINVAGNEIATIPNELMQLSTLEALYLAMNNLTTLPDDWKKLKGLKELDVSGNELTVLPSSFSALNNLEWLAAGFNQLSDLPEISSKFLEWFDIRGNDSLVVKEDELEEKIFFDQLRWEEGDDFRADARLFFEAKKYSKAFKYQKRDMLVSNSYQVAWRQFCIFGLFANQPKETLNAIDTIRSTGIITEQNPTHFHSLDLYEGFAHILLGNYEKGKSLLLKENRYNNYYQDEVLCNLWYWKDHKPYLPWTKVCYNFLIELENAGVTHPDFGKLKVELEK